MPTSGLWSNLKLVFWISVHSGCLLAMTSLAGTNCLLSGCLLCRAWLICVENWPGSQGPPPREFIWTIYSLLFCHSLCLEYALKYLFVELFPFVAFQIPFVCMFYTSSSSSPCTLSHFLSSLGSLETQMPVPAPHSYPHSYLPKAVLLLGLYAWKF